MNRTASPGHLGRWGLLLLPFALLGAVACVAGITTGTGAATTETRDVGMFSRIDVSAGIGATVTIGPAGPLTVSAESNVLPLISTTIENGVLTVRSSGSFISPAGVEVTVTTPTLDGVTLSGGSHTRIVGLAGQAFAIDLSGGSVLTASGSEAALALTSSGGSRASLDELAATTVTLDASGGSVVIVKASGDGGRHRRRRIAGHGIRRRDGLRRRERRLGRRPLLTQAGYASRAPIASWIATSRRAPVIGPVRIVTA